MITKLFSSTKILRTTAFLLFTTGACQKDFLDRTPLGDATYDTFFENEGQAVAATNAIYNQFRQWDCIAFPWIGLTDIISDDADKGSTPTDALYMLEIDDYTFDATNSNFSGVWRGYYNAIARANLAILRVPDVEMDENLKKRLIGEAKFLRAYSYFLLVQWFGDLPIITEPLEADEYYTQTRRPVEEVYNQIESDLLDAVASLPEKEVQATSKDLGRATKGAARGILAKLYMLKKDYPKAEQYCLDIINSGDYGLLQKYADNFLPIGENGLESVFEITAAALPPIDGVTGPGATPYNMIQGVRGNPNLGWGFNRPSDNLVSAYEDSKDPRRDATIIYEEETLPDGTVVKKNPEILQARFNQKAWVPSHTGLQDNGPGNIRILRYADILLLAAEALNENGKPAEALTYLNMVRARARKNANPIFQNIILQDITTTDKTELREKIYRERRIELAMEQHRWFDLKRWGRLQQVMQAAGKNFVPGKHDLMPIPQTEIDLTGGGIRQNPNY